MSQSESSAMYKENASESREKRRHARVRRECYAQIQTLPPRLGGINHGMSKDISEGGLRLRTFHKLDVDSHVLIQLGCEDNPDLLKLVGSVVWASPADAGQQWELGVTFSDINTRTREHLQQLSISPAKSSENGVRG